MRTLYCILVASLVIISGCDAQEPGVSSPDANLVPQAQNRTKSLPPDLMDHRPVLAYAEYITDPASGEPGRVEWFVKDVGNGQLQHDFVYGDPRRVLFNGGSPGVTYGVNTGHPSADVNLTDQNGWLHTSLTMWDDETCADLTLSENAINPANPGLVYNFFTTGVINLALLQADVTQVGFYGISPLFAPNTATLGVTYTLMWTDAEGNLTDIDGNGKFDVALREIYYNDQYEWADNGLEGLQPDGTRLFDFPSVAIHEAGHGVGAAHFGNIGVKDGWLFVTPTAVMNAVYGGIMRTLTGRDRGSHCGNWAQWPNR